MQITTLGTKATGFGTRTYRIPAATKGHNIEWWYDRRSRNWIVQYKDENDYEVGESNYVGDRASAVKSAARMAKETRS